MMVEYIFNQSFCPFPKPPNTQHAKKQICILTVLDVKKICDSKSSDDGIEEFFFFGFDLVMLS